MAPMGLGLGLGLSQKRRGSVSGSTPADPANPTAGGTIDYDGLADVPTATLVADGVVSGGTTTLHGKVKSGSYGKMLYSIATPQAGYKYTLEYTPDFSAMAQQGKLAMIGFGLKADNDFLIVGLRGDGSTGIDAYEVEGAPPHGWNKQTGHTVVDGGAAINGTQAGPNYIQIEFSSDGTTFTFRTSADGSTFDDEFTASALTPFSNISGATDFGPAAWINNTDTGQFSVEFSLWEVVQPPTVRLDQQYIEVLSPFPGRVRLDQQYVEILTPYP